MLSEVTVGPTTPSFFLCLPTVYVITKTKEDNSSSTHTRTSHLDPETPAPEVLSFRQGSETVGEVRVRSFIARDQTIINGLYLPSASLSWAVEGFQRIHGFCYGQQG